MAERIVKTNLMVILLVLTGLMVHSLFVQAGNLEPSAAPGSTMKNLDEIYDAVTATPPEREPYFKEFNLNYNGSNEEIFTVPEGKRLVILKMYITHYNWRIDTCSIGNCDYTWQFETILQGSTFDGFSDTMQYVHEFPDGSIAFEGGQTLWLVNRDLQGTNLKALLFGYVCDAQ